MAQQSETPCPAPEPGGGSTEPAGVAAGAPVCGGSAPLMEETLTATV